MKKIILICLLFINLINVNAQDGSKDELINVMFLNKTTTPYTGFSLYVLTSDSSRSQAYSQTDGGSFSMVYDSMVTTYYIPSTPIIGFIVQKKDICDGSYHYDTVPYYPEKDTQVIPIYLKDVHYKTIYVQGYIYDKYGDAVIGWNIPFDFPGIITNQEGFFTDTIRQCKSDLTLTLTTPDGSIYTKTYDTDPTPKTYYIAEITNDIPIILNSPTEEEYMIYSLTGELIAPKIRYKEVYQYLSNYPTGIYIIANQNSQFKVQNLKNF